MAQWPFPIPPMANKPPTPETIPDEWQKAIEALKAVIPKSTSSENSPNKTEPPVIDLTGDFDWQNTYTGYPGYPGYPNYGYYNYNYNYMINTNQVFMNPLAVPHQQLTAMSSQNGESTDSKVEKTSNFIASVTQQPPPPPPPASSQPNSGPAFYTDIITKQAPGSGNIKFTLPKKKIQINQGMKLNRKNCFANSKENSYEDARMKQNILKQKSVSSMMTDSWPQCLKDYVTAAFGKCKTDKDKDEVEVTLKLRFVKEANENTLLVKDWSKEPLPITYSERLEMEQKRSLEIEQKMAALREQSKHNTSLSTPKNDFQNRSRHYRSRSRSPSRSRSHSRSRSRSRSRSQSRTPPPRRVIHRKRYSSSSSPESSDDSRGSRKILSSSVIGPADFRHKLNNSFKNKKKNKKKGNKMSFTVDPEFSSDERLQKRAVRFEAKGNKRLQSNQSLFTITSPFIIDETGDFEWSSDSVIGTCTELVKPFLRLTGAVDPSTVRPEEILVKSLAKVKEHWMENLDYHFACEQLKSIRQDLVVQCIRNNFTIQVYETHARIALEKGDHTEFNQCQSQLRGLYEELNQGNRLEFTGYHILYTIYTENTLETKNILSDLSDEDKQDEVVSHALKIAKAWSHNNYIKFFKLYLSSPKMSSFIIDWFTERMRKTALKAIIKSYRPNIPVSYIESTLAFPSTDDCMAFLTKANLIFGNSGVVINCKESMAALANF